MTKKTLEQIFDEIVESDESPSKTIILSFTERYPYFRKEIIEFISEWMLQMELQDSNGELDTRELARKAISDMHLELLRRDDASEKMRGIFAQSKSIGLKIETAAEELGVNVRLLDHLDHKRVNVATIPFAFLQALAARIHVTARRLAEWLAEGNPQMPVMARLGHGQFRKPVSMTFDDAWHRSGLTSEALRAWTALSQSMQKSQ